MPRVLLTFTGFHDPFWRDGVDGNEQEGPVLSLLRHHPVDQVFLFSTPSTEEISDSTAIAIRERHPHTAVEVAPISLSDPTSYTDILSGIRKEVEFIQRETGAAEYFVATASGTPQMHACWLLLVAAGEIPARLLHVRPPRFAREGQLLVSEINLAEGGFPVVRPPRITRPMASEVGLSVAAEADAIGLVGDHPSHLACMETAALLGRADVAVLIIGESGTGKEKIAHLVHRASERRNRPFIALNCAAIPLTLAESTLFGHKRGSFTGADSDRPGAFVEAHGGTLFLDEFAELSLEVQAKLLRAIEYGEIQTIGKSDPTRVDVRVIAATNQNLDQLIAERRFREDLFYRVNVGRIDVPPLRQRRSDILKLALHFLDRANAKYRRGRTFAPESLLRLQSYSWPGNVRELENIVTRAALLAVDGTIRPEHLSLVRATESHLDVPEPGEGFSMHEHLSRVREALIDRALDISGGNRSEAARLLGVSPQAISQALAQRR